MLIYLTNKPSPNSNLDSIKLLKLKHNNAFMDKLVGSLLSGLACVTLELVYFVWPEFLLGVPNVIYFPKLYSAFPNLHA